MVASCLCRAANFNGADAFTYSRQRRNRQLPMWLPSRLMCPRGQRRAQLHQGRRTQTVAEDAGALTMNPWATAISTGPANESGQTVQLRHHRKHQPRPLLGRTGGEPDRSAYVHASRERVWLGHDHLEDHRQRRNCQWRRRRERDADLRDYRHPGQRRAGLPEHLAHHGRGHRRQHRAGAPTSTATR